MGRTDRLARFDEGHVVGVLREVGIRSENHAPLSPYCVHSRGVANSLPTPPCVLGAPSMCSQITDFAFAAKCGSFGASGSASEAADAALNIPPPGSRVLSVRPPSPQASVQEKFAACGLRAHCGVLIEACNRSKPISEVVRVRDRVHEVDEGRGAQRIPGLRGLDTGRHVDCELAVFHSLLLEHLLVLVEE